MNRVLFAGVLPAVALALATGCSSPYPDEAEFDLGDLSIAEQAEFRQQVLGSLDAGWSFMLSPDAAAAVQPLGEHLDELSERLDEEPNEPADLALMYEGEAAAELERAYVTLIDKRRSTREAFESEQAEARAELEQAHTELAAEREALDEELAGIDAFVADEREVVEALEAKIEALEARQEEVADSILAAMNEAIMEHELPIRALSQFNGYSWRSWEADNSRACADTDNPLVVDARESHGVCVMVSSRPYRGDDTVQERLDPILVSGLLDYYELDETLGIRARFGRRAPDGTLRGDLDEARDALNDRFVVAENRYGTRRDLRNEEVRLDRRATSLDHQTQQLDNRTMFSGGHTNERNALSSAQRAYARALLADAMGEHVQPIGEMSDDHVFPLGARRGTAILVTQHRQRGITRRMETILTLFQVELDDGYADYERVPVNPEHDNVDFVRFRGEGRDEANQVIYAALAEQMLN
ncbi:hypothetical protein [Thioalkalivibrio sp. ALMg13-2]|uniref:hypothetical protein n=1 Tax=Thioalkalivibrio sp. ALMg13-2 TaxID=1158167 RepID=UPI000367FACA|nr:hypothetical protein [Thioalkalivibrio sp. ALMg13-2]